MSAEQYAARAVQSVKDGNQAEALADFNKAVELAPEKPINYRNRAAFFSLTKQWDKAIADYDTVLSLEKNDPAIGTESGLRISFNLANWIRRWPILTLFSRCNPTTIGRSGIELTSMRTQKQYAKAVEDLTKLIEKNPSDPQSYKARADCQCGSGEMERRHRGLQQGTGAESQRPRIGIGSRDCVFACWRQRQGIV